SYRDSPRGAGGPYARPWASFGAGGVAGLYEVLLHAAGRPPGAAALSVLLSDGASMPVLRRHAIVCIHVGGGHLGFGAPVSAWAGFLRWRAGGGRGSGLGDRERADVVRAVERVSMAGARCGRRQRDRDQLGAKAVR